MRTLKLGFPIFLAALFIMGCSRPERRLDRRLDLKSTAAVELSPRGLRSLRELLHLYSSEGALNQRELKIVLGKYLPTLAAHMEEFFDEDFLARTSVSADEVLESLKKGNVVIRLAAQSEISNVEKLTVAIEKELEAGGMQPAKSSSVELRRLLVLSVRTLLLAEPEFSRAALTIGKALAEIEREAGAIDRSDRPKLLEGLVRRLHLLSLGNGEFDERSENPTELTKVPMEAWYSFALQYLLLARIPASGDLARTLEISGMSDFVEVVSDPDNPAKNLVIDRSDRQRALDAQVWDPLEAADFSNLRGARVMHRWLFEILPVDQIAISAIEELSWWVSIRHLYRAQVMSETQRRVLLSKVFPVATSRLQDPQGKVTCCKESPEIAAEFGAEWVSMTEFDFIAQYCASAGAPFRDLTQLRERIATFNQTLSEVPPEGRTQEGICSAWRRL